jgi:hypothetical protein
VTGVDSERVGLTDMMAVGVGTKEVCVRVCVCVTRASWRQVKRMTWKISHDSATC